jgi:hypothetical protein
MSLFIRLGVKDLNPFQFKARGIMVKSGCFTTTQS